MIFLEYIASSLLFNTKSTFSCILSSLPSSKRTIRSTKFISKFFLSKIGAIAFNSDVTKIINFRQSKSPKELLRITKVINKFYVR